MPTMWMTKRWGTTPEWVTLKEHDQQGRRKKVCVVLCTEATGKSCIWGLPQIAPHSQYYCSSLTSMLSTKWCTMLGGMHTDSMVMIFSVLAELCITHIRKDTQTIPKLTFSEYEWVNITQNYIILIFFLFFTHF